MFTRFALCMAALLVLLTACSSHNYTLNSVDNRSQYPGLLEKGVKDKWFMILYSGVNVYSIKHVELDKPRQQMTVQLDQVDSLHQYALAITDSIAARGKKNSEGEGPVMRVFMSDSTSYTLDEPHTIPVDKIRRIEKMQ